jgi:hypothetical protein
MIVSSFLSRTAAALVLTGTLSLAAVSGASAQSTGEFDGSQFQCLTYTNGLGENASGKTQSMLARIWMEGYLAGYLKGQNKLEMSTDPKDGERVSALMLQKCREFPNASILTVSQQAIAKEKVKLPSTTVADFAPGTYTCAQHSEAKKGGAAGANKADIAELWGLAFIQGYKNVAQPDMVIGMENKPALTGAIAKNCDKMQDRTFADLLAMVAQAVKM